MNDGKRKMSKAAKILTSVLTALLIIIFAVYFVPLFAVLSGRNTHIEGDPKVMVIFGYQLNDDGSMSPLLVSRLDTALEYIAEHEDVTVIVSGGKGDEGKRSEAQSMHDYLLVSGVAEDKILKEEGSATTAENIRNTLALIDERGLDASQGVLLVSNEFHLYRIKMLFKRSKSPLKASVLAAPSTPASSRAMMYLREPLALLADFLMAKF